eukprot:363488-Chlamydomonas_euryale.AAC.7
MVDVTTPTHMSVTSASAGCCGGASSPPPSAPTALLGRKYSSRPPGTSSRAAASSRSRRHSPREYGAVDGMRFSRSRISTWARRPATRGWMGLRR